MHDFDYMLMSAGRVMWSAGRGPRILRVPQISAELVMFAKWQHRIANGMRCHLNVQYSLIFLEFASEKNLFLNEKLILIGRMKISAKQNIFIVS